MKYNFETLRSYALWYYFRYFPSVKRLQEKMLEKAKDQKLVEKVYKDIVHLTQEKQVMIDKIHIYLIRNKNLNYIRQQLMVKGFEKDMIGEILEEYFLQDGKSLLQENSLFIKIQNYKSSHKSLRFIRQKFIERPEDKDVVEEVISQVYPDGE